MSTKLNQLLQEERNKRSQELFNKDECELNLEEQIKLDMYIHDLAYPQWKPVIINNYKTLYKISNTGILLNKNDKQVYPTLNHKGYAQISIVYDKGKKITTTIHRLVAIAFIPNSENKPQVNHINGKQKTVNWVGNLEWNTAEENIKHAHDTGLVIPGIGEQANASIYTDEDIHNVCKLLETGKYLNTEISKMTNVDVSTISKIKCKEEWLHISSQYNIIDPVKNATGESAAASIYKEKDIHEVCKYLEKGTKMTEISKQTKVGYDMIYRIKKGLNWKEVSSQYHIPGLNSKPDTINSNKIEQCSTTIGQLCV